MNSRVRGNSSSHHPNAREKHSIIPKNTPSFPRRRESTIPAHAGIQRPTTPMPEKNTPSFPKTLRHSQKHSVIPAKAGIHNSRARGNSTSHHPMPEKNTPSFPKTLRHSREGGNPQFPRTREFNVPLLQCPRKTLRHSRMRGNDADNANPGIWIRPIVVHGNP